MTQTRRHIGRTAALALTAVLLAAGTAGASNFVLGFEVEDDFVTALVNGQDLSTPPEFGTLVSISSTGGNAGAAIFDSTPGGPNAGGGDPDLLVGLGNIVILQSSGLSGQTTPGIFDTPDDSNSGGSVIFDFLVPSTLFGLDLVDINGNADTDVILTDGSGRKRTYTVPEEWTFDVTDSPNGFDTLDLTTLAGQLGEGGSTATAAEDCGFDPNDVVRLEVAFSSSGGLDNLEFIPEPASMALVAFGSLAAVVRRRRRRLG